MHALWHKISILLLFGFFVSLTSGCAVTSTADDSTTNDSIATSREILTDAKVAPAVKSVEVARQIFANIDDLMKQVAADDGTVVIGKTRSSEEIAGNATSNGVPIEKGSKEYIAATRTSLDVTDVLWGTTARGTALTVRQHGAPHEVLSALPKMRDGSLYLVFLKPFEYVPGKPTGDWTVVGLDAIWEGNESGEFQLVTPADGTKPRYPSTLSVAEAQQLVDQAVG